MLALKRLTAASYYSYRSIVFIGSILVQYSIPLFPIHGPTSYLQVICRYVTQQTSIVVVNMINMITSPLVHCIPFHCSTGLLASYLQVICRYVTQQKSIVTGDQHDHVSSCALQPSAKAIFFMVMFNTKLLHPPLTAPH